MEKSAAPAGIKPRNFPDSELLDILEERYDLNALQKEADFVRKAVYGKAVYIRGLIEFTNYCKNGCFYCGIRAQNTELSRYRLTKEQILECCKKGYTLGFRTFVLQGGEDPFFTDERLCEIIRAVKTEYPDCALTLSAGEKTRSSYKKLFDAGADRYLLRQESADNEHYSRLHPKEMSGPNRKRCLSDLKEIGFAVGAGFMVGSPYQTNQNIIEDLRFMQTLDPDMTGIGPFIAHSGTPFARFENGSVKKTLALISVLRLMFPWALIPATTALGTLDPYGREKGLKAGANVVMPNLSPEEARTKYTIYENKLVSGAEDASQLEELKKRVSQAGYEVVVDIGNAKRGEILY